MRWVFLSFSTACALATPTEDLAACGGLAGLPCDDGTTCQDDPSDDCDPDAGGADCLGLCFDCDALGREYLGTWPGCELADWTCSSGGEKRVDPACGCWCDAR